MRKVFAFLFVIVIWSCSSSEDSDDQASSDPVLTTLQISSSNGNQLDLNGTSTSNLSVNGLDQFGNAIAISGTITWSVNNSNVAITQGGVVNANSVGSTIVTASAGGKSANITLTILDSTPLSGTFIYVSDAAEFTTGPWKILRYDENGQNPVTFINQGLSWPQDILFLEDVGEVLVSSLSSNTINRYNAATGALIGSFATGISGPTRMKIGADNLLYVLQWSGNGKVLRYQLNGTFIDEFTSTGVSNSIGLDWDAGGNLYVSSFDKKAVYKFDANGNSMGTFATTALQGPTDIWFDTEGNLWVNDWEGNNVKKYNANGNFLETAISGLLQPEGVDFFPNGNFLIGSGGTSQVKMYNSNGTFISNLVSTGSGGLVQPNAVRIRTIE